MIPLLTEIVEMAQPLNNCTPQSLGAGLYLFFLGVFLAFTMGAFSMIVRATKGAGREVDL